MRYAETALASGHPDTRCHKPFLPEIHWQLALVYPAQRHRARLIEVFAAIVRDGLSD